MTQEIKATVWNLQLVILPDTTKDFSADLFESLSSLDSQDKAEVLYSVTKLANPMLNRLQDKLEMLTDELNELLDSDSNYYQENWEGTDDEGYHIMSNQYNSYSDINENLKWLNSEVIDEQWRREQKR